jgi:hypothetical protein
MDYYYDVIVMCIMNNYDCYYYVIGIFEELNITCKCEHN